MNQMILTYVNVAGTSGINICGSHVVHSTFWIALI